MKTNTLVNIIVVVTLSMGVNCIQSESQMALFAESLNTELRTTNTGRAILMMAQLSGDKLDNLLAALDNLKQSVQDGIDQENVRSQQADTRSFSDRQYYNKQLQLYKTKLAQLQVDIRMISKQQDTQQSLIQSKGQEMDIAKKQRAYIARTMEQDGGIFKDRVSVLTKSIVTIDEAVKLLEQAKQSTSFIETHEDTYQVIGEHLQEALEPQYRPIAQTLLDLAEYKFAEYEVLRKSIRILSKIRNDLADERIKLNSSYTAMKSQNERLIQQYDDKINQMTNEVLKSLQSDFLDQDTAIKTKKAMIMELQESIATFDAASQSLDKEDLSRLMNSRKIVSEYKKELKVIDDCIRQLKQRQ